MGFLDDSNSLDGNRLGAISDLREVVDRLHPKRIVVGLRERRSNLPVTQLLELRLSGIRIEDALSTYEMAFERISTHELRPSQLIFSSSDLGPNRTGVRLQIGLFDGHRGVGGTGCGARDAAGGGAGEADLARTGPLPPAARGKE